MEQEEYKIIKNENRRKKSNAILWLEDLAFQKAKERNTLVPHNAIPRKHYDDSTANGLTKAILDHCRYCHHFGTRINTTGVYDESKRAWRPSTTIKGFPDLVMIYHGRFVGIEVKIGKDRQSRTQAETSRLIRRSGGIYIIVRNFDDFMKWYNSEELRRARS